MSDLVSKTKLLTKLRGIKDPKVIISTIENFDTMPDGRWLRHNGHVFCSKCGSCWIETVIEFNDMKYCPKCGTHLPIIQ